MAAITETLKALRGSIAKWKRLSEGRGADDGCRNCPLCKLFIFDNCIGCPVKEYSGFWHCTNTPFETWTLVHTGALPRRATTVRLRRMALDEYRFLLKVRDRYRETIKS